MNAVLYPFNCNDVNSDPHSLFFWIWIQSLKIIKNVFKIINNVAETF